MAGETTCSAREVLELPVVLDENVLSALFEIAIVLMTKAIMGTALIDEYIRMVEPSSGLIASRRETLRLYTPQY